MEKQQIPQHNTSQPLFTIFHFNDVYDIQPDTKQPKAGAAYFNALLHREKQKYEHPLTLFSGDAFAPSLLSTEFQGQHMIKPLNSFGIDLACFGNHDLDFSIDHVMQLISKTNFPWLLSNVIDTRTHNRLANGLQYKIIERNGVKIGVFSLAEKQWIDTLYPFYKQFCEYIPFLQFAQYMVKKLKQQEKCDMIIALTHMMKYNDVKLAQNVEGIDLILGGHDHLIVHELVKKSVVTKSGTNFRNFSIIQIRKNSTNEVKQIKFNDSNSKITNEKWAFNIILKEVNHQVQKIQPDQQLNEYISEIYSQFAHHQEKIACFATQYIDLRFKTIRKEQTPFLQFLASVYRHFTGGDCAFMNSGNFRMDCQIPPGPITFGTMTNVINDKVIVKYVTGKLVYQALQNCVSMYPNLAGRYSVFSGLCFTWDCQKPSNHRILKQTIRINGQHLIEDKVYKVAMHSFMGLGGDGFQCFKDCPMTEDCVQIDNLHIIHELLILNHDLLQTYTPKYPGRFDIIQHQGQKYLNLHLPNPKNIKRINYPEQKHTQSK